MESDRQTWEGIDGLSLLAILVIGVFLRCYPIHENVWIDELHTAWSVVADGNDFNERVRLGNNEPLYFLFVKSMTDLVGLSEWTLRAVSLLAGVLVLPLTYWMSRSWKCSIGASLLATALVAIDRNAVFYSIEARPYACVQLFSLVHLFLFTQLLQRKQSVWHWIGWNVSGVLMFQTHCTSALVFVGQFVAYFFLSVRKFDIKLHWIYFALGQLVLLAGMLPSINLIRDVADRRDNWSVFVNQTHNPLAMLTVFPVAIYVLLPVVLWMIVLAANALRLRFVDPDEVDAEIDEPADDVPNEQSSLWVPMIVTVCWLFVPLFLAWILTEQDVARLFYRRYLMASSIALAPLTALLLSYFFQGSIALWVHRAILLTALLTISSARYAMYGSAALAHSSEDWKTPINIINADSAEIPIVLYSGLVEATAWHVETDSAKRDYCELPVRGLYSVSDDHPVISLPARSPLMLGEHKIATMRQLAKQNGLWLLIRGNVELASNVENEVLKLLGPEARVGVSADFGSGSVKRIHLRRIEKLP